MSNKTIARKQIVTIRETRRGWLNKHTGRYHSTAVSALRSINRNAKQLAGATGACITVITWESTTKAGTAIVKAIQP